MVVAVGFSRGLLPVPLLSSLLHGSLHDLLVSCHPAQKPDIPEQRKLTVAEAAALLGVGCFRVESSTSMSTSNKLPIEQIQSLAWGWQGARWRIFAVDMETTSLEP